MNLLNKTYIRTIFRGSTSATSTNHSATASHVDMANYDGCLMLCSIVENTAGVTTGGFELVPYHSDSTASTSFTALGATAYGGLTATVTTAMQGMYVGIDIYRPTKRYLSAHIHKDGAASLQASPIFTIQYDPRKMPITQSTSYCIEAVDLTSPTT